MTALCDCEHSNPEVFMRALSSTAGTVESCCHIPPGMELGPRLIFFLCCSVQVQSTEEMILARNGIYTSVRDFLAHDEFLLPVLKAFTQCCRCLQAIRCLQSV